MLARIRAANIGAFRHVCGAADIVAWAVPPASSVGTVGGAPVPSMTEDDGAAGPEQGFRP